MRRWLVPLAVAMWAAAAPAAGQGVDSGRYLLKDVEGGFIRLDTGTGKVSYCRPQDGQWRCDSVADDREALQAEIAALAEEKAKLERRIVELEEELARRGTDSGSKLELPSDEEVDRVMTFFEKIMRRFMDFARSLGEDPGRET